MAAGKSTEAGRRLRARRAAAGLCVACGLVPPKARRLRCEACIGDDIARRDAWRARHRPTAERNGLCTTCLKVPARRGRRSCFRCSLRAAARQRKRRASRSRKEVA